MCEIILKFNQNINNCFAKLAVVLAIFLVSTAGRINLAWCDIERIENIKVIGSQRIDPETVVSYSKLKIGELLGADKLDAALKRLFVTGLFADVNLERSNGTLVINVTENPVVNRIAFEGNKRIESNDLELELQLKPRIVFTRTKVQQDVQRLLRLYRMSGRFAAHIEPKVVRLNQNRVDLIFEIEEGPLSRIRNISFIGNKKFSDSELTSVINTKEYAFWKILTTGDTYDPDRLSYDRELLRRFYLNEGYVDFKVLSAVAELTPDQKDFVVTFSIDEGKRYKFGVIDLSLNLKGLEKQELISLLSTIQGDWYETNSHK